MKSYRLLACSLLLLCLSAMSASPAQAQDCGDDCVGCPTGWEGQSFSTTGPYNMTCFAEIPFCVACGPLVSDHVPGVEHIVDLLQSGSPTTLADLVVKYGDRLLLSPRRNLVVVQGTDCDPQALATVVFVSSEQARALENNLGLRLLEDYLKDQSPTT